MEPLSELVRRYQQARDEGARCHFVDEILKQVRPALWGFLANRLEPDVAQEVLQETLVAIVRGLIRYSGHGDQFWSWCYTIGRRKLATQLRKRYTAREQLIDREALWDDIEEGAAPSGLSAGERLDLKQALQMLMSVKEPCFDYLWQRYVFGWDIKEIAHAAGKSYDATRVYIERCLKLAQSLMG